MSVKPRNKVQFTLIYYFVHNLRLILSESMFEENRLTQYLRGVHVHNGWTFSILSNVNSRTVVQTTLEPLDIRFEGETKSTTTFKTAGIGHKQTTERRNNRREK